MQQPGVALDGKLQEHPADKMKSIEAGRGVAAVLVVLYHAVRLMDVKFGKTEFGSVFLAGHAGVDFFFVLSGFIITHAHWSDVGKVQRLPRYAWRRLTRIYPGYWAVAILTLALYVVSPSATGRETDFDVIFRSFLLLPSDILIVGVAWTLILEMIFYVLFALALVNRTLGTAVLGLWFLLACAGLFRGEPLPGALSALSSPYQIQFFMGMAVAWFLRRRSLARPLPIVLAGIVAFATVYAAELLLPMGVQHPLWRVAYGSASALILAGAAECDCRSLWRVPRFLEGLGTASYSIYLVHLLFIMIAQEIIYRLDTREVLPRVLVFVLLAGGAVAAGIVFSWIVERPLLRYCRAGAGFCRLSWPRPTGRGFGA